MASATGLFKSLDEPFRCFPTTTSNKMSVYIDMYIYVALRYRLSHLTQSVILAVEAGLWSFWVRHVNGDRTTVSVELKQELFQILSGTEIF